MKNGDNSSSIFEVRRSSRWPGPFHQERLGGRGPWRSWVGAHAAGVLNRYPSDIRERILLGRAQAAVRTLAQYESAVQQVRTDKARAYYIRKRDQQRERASRQPTLRADAHLPLSEAVAYWWPALEEVGRHNGRVTRELAERWWADKAYPWWVTCYPPFGTRGETVQTFYLWQNEAVASFVLSCAFGLAAGLLGRCRKCGKAFVRSPRQHNQGACSSCLREETLRTAVGLSPTISRLYQGLRKRLDQRVARGRMTPQERSRRLSVARDDARRVSKKAMSIADWRGRHDRREKRGPKADARLSGGNGHGQGREQGGRGR